MKISVLVPIYGVEKYIARCAESLFGQTYADLEFVFVDDCTPDHSIDVLRSVMARYPARQAQVRIIHNEKNSGIGAVRQKLIDSCTGDCLTFVDSDDYMPLDAISLLAAGMERSGADMVDGGWQRVTRDGISAVNKPYQGGDERRYLSLLLCQNMVSNRMWGRLYRRRLFTDNGIRLVPGIDFCEDFSVMTRLMFYARRSFINARLRRDRLPARLQARGRRFPPVGSPAAGQVPVLAGREVLPDNKKSVDFAALADSKTDMA